MGVAVLPGWLTAGKMRSRSLRCAVTSLRQRPLRQAAAQPRSTNVIVTAFRGSATVPTVTAPHRSKPLTLRKARYDDVTVRRSVLSNSGGTALSVTGPTAKACEALDLESAGEPLVLVVASNQTALRQALGSTALTHSNIIGAVDALAFAESDQLHVVACKLPPHVEAWTFDAKHGALPDLGRRRLEAALAKHTAPHFLVFGGDAAHEDDDDFDDDDGDDDAAALERFARRVDGLFPHGTCAGAAARVNGAVLARISVQLHAIAANARRDSRVDAHRRGWSTRGGGPARASAPSASKCSLRINRTVRSLESRCYRGRRAPTRAPPRKN